MSGRERGNGQGSVTTLKDSKGKKKYQVTERWKSLILSL